MEIRVAPFSTRIRHLDFDFSRYMYSSISLLQISFPHHHHYHNGRPQQPFLLSSPLRQFTISPPTAEAPVRDICPASKTACAKLPNPQPR